MLKILGAGMPRTGTKTLCEALKILGFDAIHHAPERMGLFPIGQNNGWAAFDDVDAATDSPAAMYWRELYKQYQCKIILTVRDVDTWWESIKRHANQIRVSANIEHIRYTEALHSILFGTPVPCEYWYKRRFAEHNAFVRGGVRRRDLLVMDIVGGDKWEKLCRFLKIDEPVGVDWPWENKAN